MEILLGRLSWRPCTETLHRDLLPRFCHEAPYRDLATRPLLAILCIEFLPGHLSWRPFTETLYRDLSQRSCLEVSYITHLWCQESLYREPAHRPYKQLNRSCQEISSGDLDQEVLPGDFPRDLYRDLAKEVSHKILPT